MSIRLEVGRVYETPFGTMIKIMSHIPTLDAGFVADNGWRYRANGKPYGRQDDSAYDLVREVKV